MRRTGNRTDVGHRATGGKFLRRAVCGFRPRRGRADDRQDQRERQRGQRRQMTLDRVQ